MVAGTVRHGMTCRHRQNFAIAHPHSEEDRLAAEPLRFGFDDRRHLIWIHVWWRTSRGLNLRSLLPHATANAAVTEADEEQEFCLHTLLSAAELKKSG